MNTLNPKQHNPQANQTATLVKDLMREFGLDYQLEERLLEVRLRHGRKLVVTLPADNAALAQKWLDQELTKDLHLINAFHNLFDYTDFAITDFIYCRDFYYEIKVEI